MNNDGRDYKFSGEQWPPNAELGEDYTRPKFVEMPGRDRRDLAERKVHPMSGWQDISTAPFELDDFGCRWLTWCLLWVPDEHGGLPVVGGMDADMWLWRVDDRSCGDFETPPTHWMPLPPPPSKGP